MKPRITLLTLGVDDLEKSVAFYRDGLGLSTKGIVGTEYEHGAVAFFDLQSGLKLALWKRDDLANSIAGDRGVDGPGPEVDTAAHAAGLGESLLAQVHRGVETADAMMANRDDGPVLWPRVYDLFRERLIHERAALDSRDVIFLRSSDIDQSDGVLLHQGSHFRGRDFEIRFHGDYSGNSMGATSFRLRCHTGKL